MKDRTLLKLKKQMETGAKTIALGDKTIAKIHTLQQTVVDEFTALVTETVRKSEAEIDYHKDVIEQAKGMTL